MGEGHEVLPHERFMPNSKALCCAKTMHEAVELGGERSGMSLVFVMEVAEDYGEAVAIEARPAMISSGRAASVAGSTSEGTGGGGGYCIVPYLAASVSVRSTLPGVEQTF